jgi:dipeptidyl aminopeptidase/acylaminoacyl peptidase
MTSSTDTQLRPVEAGDLLRLQFPMSVAVSPDGSSVAYTVMEPNGETNRNHFSLWVVPATGGDPRKVVGDEFQDPSPEWSPDGSMLAFVGRQGSASQIFIADIAGDGAVRQLTHDDAHAATMPVWSPDGSQLLYLCRLPSLPEPWYPVPFPAGSTRPKVIGRKRYKFDGMGWLDHRRNHLFVVDVGGGEPRQLTDGPTGVGHPVWTAERGVPVGRPAWSPDGARVAFVMSLDEDEENEGLCDVWTVDVASGQMVRITPHDGLYGAPAWSPDGSRLAVIGTPFPRTVGYVNRLWTVPSGGGSLTLAIESELAVGSGILSDSGAPVQAQPAWVQSGIHLLAASEGTSQVWVAGEGGEPRLATGGLHAISSWSVSGDGRVLAFNASTPTNPGEIFIQSQDDPGSARQVTNLNEPLLSKLSLGTLEEYWATPPDDAAPVHSWVMKPPGFTPGERYPLVLQMHGGPTALYGWSWYHEFQVLASRGFVVVIPNPRGSAGYGQDFATAIYRDWWEGPTTDLLAAMDHVIGEGYVDTDRLFLTGGSYGGYLVNWIITQTDRFRAGLTGRCVSDLRTLVLADDIGSILKEHFGGMPWDDPELYALGSPITHIAQCKTPLLIEHQEADHRCPIDQAEQMYNALREFGVPVEMVLYPNESHGMSRNGAPLNRVDRVLRMVEWFERPH